MHKIKSIQNNDIANQVALTLTIGISCYYLFLLSGKYYSPLSDFFAFKEIAEGIFNFHLEISSKRLPVYPFLMGLVAKIIPAKKAILYAGILISNFSYIGSIFLIHKIGQQIGIKNSFLVSWFFAFSTLSLYCATQPLPEATILFLILLSLYVKSDKLSLYISGLATFTRFDAAIAIFANIPKIIIERKRRLIFLFFLILLIAVIFLGFYYLETGKTGYIGSIIGPKPFVIDKVMGNFVSLLRTINLFFMPDDHHATVSPETRFHAQWWVQLIWLINIFVISVGVFHLIKLNKPNHWKVLTFFLLYFLFLWLYYYTDWRKMYLIVWFFPLYTIAGIEYLLLRWQKRKKFLVVSLVILGVIVIYSVFNTPYVKNLYHEFFSLGFELNSLSRFLIFLPICVYVFFKERQTRSKKYLVLMPLFLVIIPLISTHIAAIKNLNAGLWDLKAGMKVVKNVIKEDEKIFMPDKMVNCATYLSDIPEKNIVTYHNKDLPIGNIKYIASFRSWDRDPVLKQLENNPKTITIKNQEVNVTEIYHVGIFRLFEVVSKI